MSGKAWLDDAGQLHLDHYFGVTLTARQVTRRITAAMQAQDAVAQIQAAMWARPGRWPDRPGQEQKGHQVAAAEALAIKEDPADRAGIRAIQRDMAALHEG